MNVFIPLLHSSRVAGDEERIDHGFSLPLLDQATTKYQHHQAPAPASTFWNSHTGKFYPVRHVYIPECSSFQLNLHFHFLGSLCLLVCLSVHPSVCLFLYFLFLFSYLIKSKTKKILQHWISTLYLSQRTQKAIVQECTKFT